MDSTQESQIQPSRPAVIGVASFGGHIVQLMRVLQPLNHKYSISYISTSPQAQPSSCQQPFYTIDDFSRTTPWLILKTMRTCYKIFRRTKPKAIVSTGAAPGLSAIIVGRLMGIRTLWIDSIANAERLSMCGRIAARVAHLTLTQWPDLADGKRAKHCGTVL